jgi:hypothetical protein
MSVDQALVERARELTDSGKQVPSKSALQKTLKVGWDRATEIHRQLSSEAEVAARGRALKRRRSLSKLRPRKGTGRALAPRPQPLPEPFRKPSGRVVTWPAVVVAIPAAVAIWAGWVAIGKLTGFGRVNLLPGFGRGWVVDTAITLPVGVEAYAAYAFYVALNPAAPARARRFAAWSAGLAVLLGMGGQTAFHLMSAAHMSAAPWQITTLVSCLPVGVFAVVAALVHLVRGGEPEREN